MKRSTRALRAMLVSVAVALVSCATVSEAARTGAPSEGQTAVSEANFQDLQCSVDTGGEGFIGEIVPSAKGEISPEAALNTYFDAKRLDLTSKDFATTAEVSGLVQLGYSRQGKIQALVAVVQVDSGGWIVSEFSACQGLIEQHAA